MWGRNGGSMFLTEAPLSEEESNRRKKRAEEISAMVGHRIGNWETVTDKNDKDFRYLEGHCLNSGCQKKMTVTPMISGLLYTPIYSFEKCPYVRN
jgi:hypothetical protein